MTLQTTNFDSKLKHADPIIAGILNNALSEKEIDIKDSVMLFSAKGIELELVCSVADELRKRRVGDVVTYVVNRNINFTNVCIKQCGFCAFSRDFREEEGYLLPVEEIVRRAKEAHELGATEVCIQAGLPPDMDGELYEKICREIKKEIPKMHIHGFSPEEILYAATRNGITIRDYLVRLKNAGVGTIPGTSAEILDQKMRDKISPGRISVKDWIKVIKSAHKIGIRSTSTMMYGHMESYVDRANHIGIIRKIQKETGGFTEFVPLNFVHTEAPMYKHGLHKGIRSGADSDDWYIYAGYLSDKLMIIPALNYERHGIVSHRPAELIIEFRLDTRYNYKDTCFWHICFRRCKRRRLMVFICCRSCDVYWCAGGLVWSCYQRKLARHEF